MYRSQNFVIVQSRAQMDTSYCLCMGSPEHRTFGPRWQPRMFPANGERLLASTASEAAIGLRHVVQLGPCGAHEAGTLTSAGLGARAGMQDRRHSWPVVRAWPGGSCKAIHGVEFGVGNSYHVVGSERDGSTARGHLAGSGMKRFPAITAGPCRGLGPIRTPESGDDTLLWGAPPHPAPRGL